MLIVVKISIIGRNPFIQRQQPLVLNADIQDVQSVAFAPGCCQRLNMKRVEHPVKRGYAISPIHFNPPPTHGHPPAIPYFIRPKRGKLAFHTLSSLVY